MNEKETQISFHENDDPAAPPSSSTKWNAKIDTSILITDQFNVVPHRKIIRVSLFYIDTMVHGISLFHTVRE